MNDFSAAPSALGYVFQFELALLEYLRREDPTAAVSLELLDDIAFEGNQTELIQAKGGMQGSLTDGSPKLWKTLRAWIESDAGYPDAVLVLITTSHAPDGSIAALLRADGERDTDRAHSRLLDIARASGNKELSEAFQAFIGMDEARRQAMVARIVVADSAPVIADLEAEYTRHLRHAATRTRLPHLIARLREWWLLVCEHHLIQIAAGNEHRIQGEMIEMKLDDLRNQMTEENLPIDLEDLAIPTGDQAAEDQRPFVMQLRLIALANQRIALAIHDHNRAFAQRARWVREDLLVLGELSQYDRRLKEEWARIFLPETDSQEESDEQSAQQRGREVHKVCEDAQVEPIRPKVTEPYVMRGSWHMLSDQREIGWHPDWVARLQTLLSESAA